MTITCHRMFLELRCSQRGYSLEEVMPCVLSQDGDEWTIDVEHASYPKQAKEGFVEPEPQLLEIGPEEFSGEFAPAISAAEPPEVTPVQANGPGTELKKLLKKLGIEATPTCSCNARARVMDERGIEWCENNLDQIVGWLREEATNRKLPFVDMAGRMLVKRAIRNAKRA